MQQHEAFLFTTGYILYSCITIYFYEYESL